MRIGIDCDGVLCDFNTSFITRIIEVTGRDLFPLRPFDIKEWDYPQSHGYTNKEINRVWESIKLDCRFWQLLPTYPDTFRSLDLLVVRAVVDDIYFITSRPGVLAKQQTENWLRAYGFPKSTVLISSEKDLCAKALKLDAYVDDKIENCRAVVAFSPKTKTFLLSRPWNQLYVEVPRVSSIEEFLRALD